MPVTTTYIYAHSTQDPVPNNFDSRALLLKEDATEVAKGEQVDGKVYVFLPVDSQIQDTRVFVDILRNFLSKSIERLTNKLQEKSVVLEQYTSASEKIYSDLDKIIQDLKGTMVKKNLWGQRKKISTLFDCLKMKEVDFQATAKETLEFTRQHVVNLKTLQSELNKIVSLFESINAVTPLDKILDFRKKVFNLQTTVNSGQFVQSFADLSKKIELLVIARDLANKYRTCIEECVRRKEFHSLLNEKIQDFNKVLGHFWEDEQGKRTEFYTRTITSRIAKEILLDLLFPVLDMTNLPVFSVDSPILANKAHDTEWITQLRNEAQELPDLQKEDIGDCSWMFMDGEATKDLTNVIVESPLPGTTDDPGIIEQEIDTDEEDDVNIHEELVKCINHKEEQIIAQAKEIENLKKSLHNSGDISNSAALSSTRQFDLLEQEISALKSQLADKDSEITLLVSANSVKSSTMETMRINEEKLIQQLAERNTQVESMREKIDSITNASSKEQEEMAQQLDNAQQEISALKKQLANTAKETSSMQEQANIVVENERKAKDAQIYQLQQHIDSTRTEYEKEILELQRKLKQTMSQMNEIQVANSNKSREMAIAHELEKKNQLESFKKEKSILEVTLAREREKNLKQQEAISFNDAKLGTLRKESDLAVQTLKEKLARMEEENKRASDSFKRDSEKAVYESSKQIKEIISNCEASISTKTNEIATLTRVNSSLSQQVSTLTTQLQASLKNVEQLKQELGKEKGNHTSTSVAPLKPNEITVTIFNFSVNDIVLFRRRPNSNIWDVLNLNTPNYFLAEETVKLLQKKQGYQNMELIRARILNVDDYLATKQLNPYNLALGTKFFVVHIYPFE